MSDSPTIAELFLRGGSNAQVTGSGRVVKMLPDDLEDRDGTGRHQRFIIEVPGNPNVTVKISHNLAFGRLRLRRGIWVRFSGEYRFNPLGGVVHWTHRDPRGNHPAGYLEVGNRRVG